jgi:hypothetical protein
VICRAVQYLAQNVASDAKIRNTNPLCNMSAQFPAARGRLDICDVSRRERERERERDDSAWGRFAGFIQEAGVQRLQSRIVG